MNYLGNNLPENNNYPANNNYPGNMNMNYPVNINNNAYKSCSNDEYDALESNVPYISKNRPYSPKSKLYHTVNNWDIVAFIVVTTLLVLLLFTTSKINNQNNNISHHQDNSPASIYQNYNEQLSDGEFYIHPELQNNRNLYEHHSSDLTYLDHFDELNAGSNYYSEYYKTRLQELCDLSLQNANKKANKIL
jgi:hypothetical protein